MKHVFLLLALFSLCFMTTGCSVVQGAIDSWVYGDDYNTRTYHQKEAIDAQHRANWADNEEDRQRHQKDADWHRKEAKKDRIDERNERKEKKGK